MVLDSPRVSQRLLAKLSMTPSYESYPGQRPTQSVTATVCMEELLYFVGGQIFLQIAADFAFTNILLLEHVFKN